MNWKLPMNCEIPLRSTKPPQGISTEIPLPERNTSCWINRRIREPGRIKCLSPRILLREKIGEYSRNEIGPDIRGETSDELREHGIIDIHGRRGPSLDN